MFEQLASLRLNARGFCIKAFSALFFSCGVLLLAGWVAHILFPGFVFNHVVLFLARKASTDGHLMAATVVWIYQQWFKLVFVIPLIGLIGIFFGFVLFRVEREGRGGLNLTDLSLVRRHAPVSPRHIFLLIALTFAAAALRMPNINQGLLIDEITAANYISNFRPWSYAGLADHRLYTFFGLISTKLFGENEFALRIPVFILGVITVPLAYFTAREFLNEKQRLLLTVLFCFSGFHIINSVNARGYIMLVFCAMLSTCLFLRIISGNFIANSKRDSFWLGLITAFGFLSHFYYIWVIFAQIFTMFSIFISEKLFLKRASTIKMYLFGNLALSLVFGCLAALLIYGPEFFLAFIKQIQLWGELGERVSFHMLGELFTGTQKGIYGIIFSVIALFGVADLWKNQRSLSVFSIFLIAIPMIIVRLTVTTFSRFFSYALPVLFIMLSRGMIFLSDKYARKISANIALSGLLASYIILQLPALLPYYQQYKTGSPGFREAGRFIDSLADKDDIIVGIGSGELAIQYYIKKHKVSNLSEEEVYRQLKADKAKLWVVVTFPKAICYVPESLRLYDAARRDLKLVGNFAEILVYHY